VLAPLTVLLVVQVSLYQTLSSAVQRIASVIVGVPVALALSRALGFTWWSFDITIAAALAIGFALRLGESLLDVPVSAMLILSLPNTAESTSSAGVCDPRGPTLRTIARSENTPSAPRDDVSSCGNEDGSPCAAGRSGRRCSLRWSGVAQGTHVLSLDHQPHLL
jgi:hypothetical protein